MPKFLLKYQGAQIREIPAHDAITIGRKSDNDIVIDNPAVSNHHCKIVLNGGTFFVHDLNSTNGVFLNGARVTQSALQNNDVIAIAKHALQFVDERPQLSKATIAAATAAASLSPDGTMMINPQRQQALASASTAAAQKNPAIIHVTSGIVDQVEYELKTGSTCYIGKARSAQVKIKGTGLFGSAPENAAMITSRPNGYFLIPVKERYVTLNGKILDRKEQLKDGDVIQAGGTTMRFEDLNA
jgi:pSer/pThr/pTyr-binding forkhead associated (FHA) protein